MQPISNHTFLKLVKTYQDLLLGAGISTEQFKSVSEYDLRLGTLPIVDISTFAQICQTIASIRLPRSDSTDHIDVSIKYGEDRKIVFRCHSKAIMTGRDLLKYLAADTAEAIKLMELFEAAARSRGYPIIDFCDL